MKNFKVRRPSYIPVFLLIPCLASAILEIKALPNPQPQWVWNKDAIDNNRQANYQQGFVGQSSSFPVSPSKESQSSRVNGQSRLLPSLISSITNIGGGGGSSGSGAGGALGGIFGSVLQTIPQFATQAIGGIFGNRPITLPAKNPDESSSSDSGVSVPITGGSGSCKCVGQNECFLPAKPTGSCDGGKVQCCSTSRTIFPDEDTSKDSTKSTRTVSQREVRRGLLRHILRGSGDVVDDTLDLILTPFLSPEDRQKLATRVISDEN